MNRKHLLILVFFACFFYSCNHPEEKKQEKVPYNKETLVKVNKGLVEKYSEIIQSYVSRGGWEMTETQTGLWYMIYEQGDGPRAEKGKYATIRYTVHLLDGTFCYRSDSLHPKKFKIGRGGVEAGLEEGILYMKEGGKAKFIIPPYIAHGLLGDEDKIPGLSIILYDVELLDVSEEW